ncbi:putative lipid II flippase FtsW [Brevibacterium sp. FME37]|uniref:putative lipid II flippase FtsW n=1 Tax=Brevibacterium sp. FME37 TaxID=2742607 RepID=UPI001869120F|nr:putative lipid II flippase FtsW [Brevibacterium sp. FME37]
MDSYRGGRTHGTLRARLPRIGQKLLRVPAVPRIDSGSLVILGASLCLVGLGLLMVLSATSITSFDGTSGSSFSIFARQAFFAAIGIIMLTVTALIPAQIWSRLAGPMIIAGLVLLSLPLIPGLGITVNGSTNWVHVGGLQLQPSEVFKPVLALWLGVALARRSQRLHRPKDLFFAVVPVSAFAFGFILLGGDLGTTLVLMLMTLAALFIAGVPKRYFAATLGVIAVGVTILVATSPYRMARVRAMFADTDALSDVETLGQHWQSNHGLFALASGGWTGTGLGASREKWFWLAEAHNDYIFAIIGEELGLLGTLTVVCLFGLLGVGLIRTSLKSRELKTKVLCLTVFVWILGQAFINMGVVTTLLPVIGVPLPLISYGGSSLVSTLIGIGLVISFARADRAGRDRDRDQDDAEAASSNRADTPSAHR